MRTYRDKPFDCAASFLTCWLVLPVVWVLVGLRPAIGVSTHQLQLLMCLFPPVQHSCLSCTAVVELLSAYVDRKLWESSVCFFYCLARLNTHHQTTNPDAVPMNQVWKFLIVDSPDGLGTRLDCRVLPHTCIVCTTYKNSLLQLRCVYVHSLRSKTCMHHQTAYPDAVPMNQVWKFWIVCFQSSATHVYTL